VRIPVQSTDFHGEYTVLKAEFYLSVFRQTLLLCDLTAVYASGSTGELFW